MPGSGQVIVETPAGSRTIPVGPGDDRRSVAEILGRAGLSLNTRCGQRGTCDGCLVEIDGGLVRACVLTGGEAAGATVRVPARSLVHHAPQVVTDFRLNVSRTHAPLHHLASPGDLGLAIDVGTTTVAVLLVELATGQVLAKAAGFNQQVTFGEDVVTRINLCAGGSGRLAELQRAIIAGTIGPLVAEAAAAAGASAGRVRACTVAGNTTMLHLFAGVDPTPMGVAPFTAAFLDARVLAPGAIPHWGEAGLACAAHLLPGAAAYVGADVMAGVLASGLLYEDGPSLLVDVGTNGEIVLKHGERLLACATAAGPAFEGAGLHSGVRAAAGAIAHVRICREPFGIEFDVIGGPRTAPVGLCGSAYVDFLGEGRRAGLLSAMGRFERTAIPADRLAMTPTGGLALRVAPAGAGAGGAPVLITEADVARLLPAKAAIAAGILMLLGRAGVAAGEVKTLYLAGGFGAHMSPAHAIACGLLPGFTVGQIQTVGNTALAGAYLALLDRTALDELGRLGPRIDVVELNTDPAFEAAYIDQFALPEA